MPTCTANVPREYGPRWRPASECPDSKHLCQQHKKERRAPPVGARNATSATTDGWVPGPICSGYSISTANGCEPGRNGTMVTVVLLRVLYSHIRRWRNFGATNRCRNKPKEERGRRRRTRTTQKKQKKKKKRAAGRQSGAATRIPYPVRDTNLSFRTCATTSGPYCGAARQCLLTSLSPLTGFCPVASWNGSGGMPSTLRRSLPSSGRPC